MSKAFPVRVAKFSLVIGVLCLFLWPASVRADGVTINGVSGSTSITFTVVSSTDLQLNIGSFTMAPGISGVSDTTDFLNSFTADLFANGTVSGGDSFIETEPPSGLFFQVLSSTV